MAGEENRLNKKELAWLRSVVGSNLAFVQDGSEQEAFYEGLSDKLDSQYKEARDA